MNKLRKISERDKVLLLILLFVILFAGMFQVYSKVQEKRVVLDNEFASLEIQRKLAVESKMDLAKMEVLLDAKLVEIEEIYTKVPDDISSSIGFETLFLGWLSGRNVKVDSFSYTKPESVRVEFASTIVPEEVVVSGLGTIANQLDDLANIEKDEDVENNVETEPEAPIETPVIEGEPPVIMAGTYNYKLELSKYEYTRLLDKINNESEFYQLQATEFTLREDGTGSGIFSIKVFAYDKPERFKIN